MAFRFINAFTNMYISFSLLRPLTYLGDFNSSVKKESGSNSDHSHDCGYSSENNNGCCETGSLISSLSSSPEGSELACSDSCCQHDTDYITHCRLSYGGTGHQMSLQEMLEVSYLFYKLKNSSLGSIKYTFIDTLQTHDISMVSNQVQNFDFFYYTN